MSKVIIVRYVFTDEEWAELKARMPEKHIRQWLYDVGMSGLDTVLSGADPEEPI